MTVAVEIEAFGKLYIDEAFEEDTKSARLVVDAFVTLDRLLAPGGPNLLGDGSGWLFLSSLSLDIPMCFGFENSFILDGFCFTSFSGSAAALGKAKFAAVAAAVVPSNPLWYSGC